MTGHAHLDEPSAWVRRFARLIPAGGQVLDLACGGGRHARYLAGLGYAVEAVDRDEPALARLAGIERIVPRRADLESAPWPYAGQRFAGIVVVNYLHRPLLPLLVAALDTPAALIYETFALGNERFGKPSNPDFLLRPGELLECVRGALRVVAFEDLFVSDPKPARVQRICAVAGELPQVPADWK
ncbi:MAG TPA: methyltransferase domain-containing protein [Burkholderiales bacterium]|nr:methyltransferase domain-containing protein [Burkholderiales bacterium]